MPKQTKQAKKPSVIDGIDGSVNDIRVLCSGPGDSDDAGLVEGVPIDPPDDNPGWILVKLWVEHDTLQEKGEKGAVTTRKVDPAYYQLWARPKSKVPAVKAKPTASVVTPPAAPPAGAQKRGRGRPRSTSATLPEPPASPPSENEEDTAAE